MSKQLLSYVKPKRHHEGRRWQRKEGNIHSLDAREHLPHPDSLPRKGADDPRVIEWSSG